MSVILQFDGGNTRLKWRLCTDDGRVIGRGANLYSDINEADFYSGVINDLKSVAGGERLEGVVYASVRLGDSLESLLAYFQSKLGSGQVREITHSYLECDRFVYEDVTRLGIDRALAIVAAYHEFECASLVLNAGSALTADFVDSKGRHLGGYIFPGVAMLRDSLLGGTSKVIVNDEVEVSTEMGDTTETCVSNARVLMLVGVLRELVGNANALSVEKVVVAGGDAPLLIRLLQSHVSSADGLGFENVIRRDELVLDGISCLVNNKEDIK